MRLLTTLTVFCCLQQWIYRDLRHSTVHNLQLPLPSRNAICRGHRKRNITFRRWALSFEEAQGEDGNLIVRTDWGTLLQNNPKLRNVQMAIVIPSVGQQLCEFESSPAEVSDSTRITEGCMPALKTTLISSSDRKAEILMEVPGGSRMQCDVS